MKKLTRVLSIALLSSLFAAAACKGKTGTEKNTPKPVEPQTSGLPSVPSQTAPAPTAPPTTAPAPTPTTPAPTAPTAATGIPECDQYSAAFERYNACDKVPQASKDAAKATLDHMREGWASLQSATTPAAAKQASADSCKTAMAALEQSAATLGCQP